MRTRPATGSRTAGGVGRTRLESSLSSNRSGGVTLSSPSCAESGEGRGNGVRQRVGARTSCGGEMGKKRGGGCDARDARKSGRETSRRWARSGEGFPRTHRVQPDGGALVVDARDGARAPFAPSALPGVVLALAKHLHGQARPVNQESRAAAGDLGLGLVLALPRLGLLRGNREERLQISCASRGRSTRARRRVRRLTVTMEKERYSGDSTAPRGGGCAEGREGGRRAPGNPCVRRRCSPRRWILLVGERGEWRVSRRARSLARERPLRAGVRRGCSLASDSSVPQPEKKDGAEGRARAAARARENAASRGRAVRGT